MFAVKRRRTETNHTNRTSTTHNNNNNNNNNHNKNDINKLKTGSKPTTLDIRGIPVHFPFTPYPCQTDYMTKVIDALNQGQNALLESPTGTGKTLCLLCAALAWQREQVRFLPQNNPTQLSQEDNINPDNNNSNNHSKRVPTILYASRTHSQISQVVQELRNTRYRPNHAVLASREQMCVHERVSKSPNSLQLNHECSKLTKERRCRFKNNLDGFSNPNNNNNGGQDPSDYVQPVMDMEDLVQMGTQQKICPFYWTRNQIKDADLIFLPYNYLFDREARKTLGAPDASSTNNNNNNNTDNGGGGGIQWKNAIVIFDEAHNLESFASESASFDLTGLDIAGCIGEIERAMNMVQMSGTEMMADNQKMHANMIKLKGIFLQFEQYLETQIPSRGGSYRGDYIFEIWKDGASLTFQNHEIFITFVKQVSDLFMEMRGAAGTPKLDHFVSSLRRTFAGSTEAQCLAKAKAYRVHVTPRKGNSNDSGGYRSSTGQFEYRTLSYWCFAPALSMHELASLGPLRSLLVTSGTLSPLPSYSMELGLPFPIQLENPHIVKSNQVHVRILSHGVSNKLLKSTYERRGDAEYILELANTLIALAKIIPGGMLVFFPSYGTMEQCIEGWGGPMRSNNYSSKDKKKNFFGPKSNQTKRFSFPHAPNYYTSTSSSSSTTSTTTPWKRLLSQKAIVMEPKSSADLKTAIAEFDKFLSMEKSTGCLLMGVCRGKISEGIDFANHRARAVIITGLPFAPFHDPKVKLKREFLDGVKMEQRIQPSGEGGFKFTSDKINIPMESKEDNKNKNNNNNNKDSGDTAISGTEWYSQQAHRAVNQAVGRVIRHRFDYGAVLLLDARFAEPRNQNGLSKWIRPYILPHEGFGKAISTLAQFYRVAAKDPLLTQKNGNGNGGGKNTQRRETREIRYEQDEEYRNQQQEKIEKTLMEETELMGSIAVIQADDKQSNQISNDGDGDGYTGYVKPERIIKRFNIHDVKREQEENKAIDTLMNTISGATKKQPPPTTTSHQDMNTKANNNNNAPPTGISALYSKQRKQQNNAKFSAGILAATSQNKDMTKTIASAWAGLDSKGNSTSTSNNRSSNNGPSTYHVSLKRNLTSSRNSHSSSSSSSSSSKMSAPSIKPPEKVVENKMHAKLFFQAASAHLSTQNFSSLRTLLVSMKAAGDKKDSRGYLKLASKVVHMLLNYQHVTVKDIHDVECTGLLPLLYPLLPRKYQSAVRKMALDIVAQKKTKLLKVAEQKRTGVVGLDRVLERKRLVQSALEQSIQTEREKNLSVTNDPNMEAERHERMAALIRTEEINLATKKEILQLQQSMKPIAKLNTILPHSRTTTITTTTNSLENPKRMSKTRAALNKSPNQSIQAIKKTPSYASKADQYLTQDMDPLDRCLREASQSNMEHTPGKPSGRSTTTNANASSKTKNSIPKNLKCTICDSKPQKPHLANCGHSACLSCWIKWLTKCGEGKGTCPVCRAKTSREDLARMVFEKKVGAGIPTLSQICNDDDNQSGSESEEEEDELEFVKAAKET